MVLCYRYSLLQLMADVLKYNLYNFFNFCFMLVSFLLAWTWTQLKTCIPIFANRRNPLFIKHILLNYNTFTPLRNPFCLLILKKFFLTILVKEFYRKTYSHFLLFFNNETWLSPWMYPQAGMELKRKEKYNATWMAHFNPLSPNSWADRSLVKFLF